MKYYVNPASLSSAFTLPSAVVDKHIKMAGAVQLKVLLYIFRNMAGDISPEAVSSYLSVPCADVCDAMRFWADAGILSCDTAAPATAPAEKTPTVRSAVIKPSREEIAQRGAQSEEIAFLLREAQQKFGRALRQNESSTLVWLHDDEGMSVAILLMLIEFAISDGKCNIGYIERTALDWIDSGVEDISDAEKKINEIYSQRSCWKQLQSAFGIDNRMASAKELKAAKLWVGDWKMPKTLLREAYNRCVDGTGKFSMAYISKIIEKWHKDGIDSIEKIVDETKPEKKNNGFAAYDSSLFDSMLNAIDNKEG